MVNARRYRSMQPTQGIGALRFRAPAERDKGAPGRGDRASGILFVAQRDAGDDVRVRRADDLHHFLTMRRDERTVNVVGRNRLDRGFFCDCFHGASPCLASTVRTT